MKVFIFRYKKHNQQTFVPSGKEEANNHREAMKNRILKMGSRIDIIQPRDQYFVVDSENDRGYLYEIEEAKPTPQYEFSLKG